MRIRNPWSPIVALACSALASACDDDATNGTVDWTYDASVDDAGTGAGTGIETYSTGTSDGIISLPPLDTAATADTLDDAGGSWGDGGDVWGDSTSAGDPGSTALGDTSVGDGGVTSDDTELTSGFDAAVTDTTAESSAPDADLPDAQVFVPDGGVLRPTELGFQQAYLEQLSVPAGFRVQVFAIPGGRTRMLAEHGGAIYVTRPEQGDVLRLADGNDDGVAEIIQSVTSGYPLIHGIAFDGDTVYLATPKQLLRGTVAGDGSFGALETLFDDLPDGGQHPLRTLGIGPDGLLYISVGSTCDACVESNPENATLLQVAQDGSSRTIFASGLRNTLGFDWHPETNELWGVDNGSDWRGNDLPPEELNRIEAGNDYGWPYCYAKQVIDPIIDDPENAPKAEYCSSTTPSVLENQAHEAPIALTFYEGLAFPEAYRGDAFVAMRGSWNRIPATGYKIARVVFEGGEPVAIEDFVTGFLNAEGLATFARPAGVTVDAQGALLFSDDSNGVIYRVTAVDAP